MEEEVENNDGDLDALAGCHKKKKKQRPWYPWPQQTEHSVKRETISIRDECHVVIFLGNSPSDIVPPRDRNESASAVTQKFLKGRMEKRQLTRRVTNLPWQYTQKKQACSQEKRRNRKSID